jgi:hypothetical protein
VLYLFKSEGCPACYYIQKDIEEGSLNNWASHVKFVDVKFNQDQQCNIAYMDGEPLDGECPVDAVPAIYSKKTDELIFGYEKIKEFLNNGCK